MKYSFAFLGALALVEASPYPRPQAVTSFISPKAPAPSGCMTDYVTSFGVVAQNITMTASKAPVSTLSDGQPQAPTSKASGSAAPVSTISDGQPQAPTSKASVAPAPITTISDGQPQAPTGSVTMKPLSQISDGQIQGPKTMGAITQISDGQIQAPTVKPKPTVTGLSQISDGQIQGPTVTPKASALTQLSDGQPQAPTSMVTSKASAAAVTTLSDGQPQAPTATKSAAGQLSDGQPQASTAKASSSAAAASAGPSMVACAGPSVLSMTLKGGVLTDSKGRTGYIASNYQFQFDGPPQAGAIYTSGWSVCGNGSLALGGETTFYQCLSGNFYNLYNKNWAAQCNPVTIDVLDLIKCS